MEAYTPGKPAAEVTRELGVSPVIKLASNENPLGPSPKAIEAVKKAAERMHAYPDASGFDLKQAIANHFQMPVETVFLGNGSDELIHMLGLLFLDSPEDELMVGDPSFVRYDAAAFLAPAKLVKVPLDSTFTHDLAAMARAATAKTKLVFVANPNNPTGTMVSHADLLAFRGDLPKSAMLVLDEAYFEFAADAPGYPNSLEMIRDGLDVVALRTFSKAYGLAGIRVGYGFAPAAVVDAFNRAREPFNVNALAQAAAVAALQDDAHIRATMENNARGMARIADALKSVGATPYPSYGNFVFADLHRPCGPIVQALMEHGIVIRGGQMFGTPTCVRVSIGTDHEVDRFVEEIQAAMKETANR